MPTMTNEVGGAAASCYLHPDHIITARKHSSSGAWRETRMEEACSNSDRQSYPSARQKGILGERMHSSFRS